MVREPERVRVCRICGGRGDRDGVPMTPENGAADTIASLTHPQCKAEALEKRRLKTDLGLLRVAIRSEKWAVVLSIVARYPYIDPEHDTPDQALAILETIAREFSRERPKPKQGV
jgi:hypothetical protein